MEQKSANPVDSAPKSASNSFAPLFLTNFFGTMNDNFLKTLAGFVIVSWLPDVRMKSVFMGITASALVLPYIFFSPLADRLTVVFSKIKILRLAKLAELPIIALAVAGFAMHSAVMVVIAIVLMGLQSSLYSPAKYALVRDVGGLARVSVGMGGMEAAAFSGVLAGTITASMLIGNYPLWVAYAVMGALALAGLLGSYWLRAQEERNRHIHSINPWRYLRRAHRLAKKYPGLNAVIVTLSMFWWNAAMLQMGLLVFGGQVLGLDSTKTGVLLCAAAVGIVAGQIVAGYVDRAHALLGTVPFSGLFAALLLFALYFVPMNAVAFAIVLTILSFDLGFFKLPLDAEIQKVVKGPRLNTMLSYFNQVSFLFMLLAGACYALIGWLAGPQAFLLLLALAMTVVPVVFAVSYRRTLIAVGRWIFSRRYKIVVSGLDQLRPEKTYLVLPNHPAMVDPMLVMTTLGDFTLRPLSDESFFHTGWVAPRVLRTLEAVQVPDLRHHRSTAGIAAARGLTDVVKQALTNGGSIIFYPSGHIQTEADVENIGNRQLAYNICRELPDAVEVIGVRTRGLWGSIWSRKGRKASPAFVPTFLKSIWLWFVVAPFKPRREVKMTIENLTLRSQEWAQASRQEFNRHLESWYNGEGNRR